MIITASLKRFLEVTKMSNNVNKKYISKFSFSRIIRNNRALMLFSLIVSFALWIWVAVEKSPITQKVITDVPVSIDLQNSVPEQLNLQIFGDKEFKVDVTVTGKKYILASLDEDDISVTANTNYVDSAGNKTLQLKYSVADGADDFEIIGLSSNYIQVYFDIYKQVELPLETNFVNDVESLLSEDCILGDIVFSKQTVSVSGPASEINRISKALATVSLTEKLEKNKTVVPQIELITEDGSSLKYSQIETDGVEITMLIPVLKIVTLPTSVEYKNVPEYYVSNPLKYSVYPAKITAAIPIDSVSTTKSLSVGTIDFADIARGINTFNIPVSDIESYKIQSSNISNFRVTVDASDFASTTISVPASKLQFTNVNPSFDIKNVQQGNVNLTIIGDPESISDITPNDIVLIADLQSVILSENVESVVATATISNGKCWIQGKPEIKVSVKQK